MVGLQVVDDEADGRGDPTQEKTTIEREETD